MREIYYLTVWGWTKRVGVAINSLYSYTVCSLDGKTKGDITEEEIIVSLTITYKTI